MLVKIDFDKFPEAATIVVPRRFGVPYGLPGDKIISSNQKKRKRYNKNNNCMY